MILKQLHIFHAHQFIESCVVVMFVDFIVVSVVVVVVIVAGEPIGADAETQRRLEQAHRQRPSLEYAKERQVVTHNEFRKVQLLVRVTTTRARVVLVAFLCVQ